MNAQRATPAGPPCGPLLGLFLLQAVQILQSAPSLPRPSSRLPTPLAHTHAPKSAHTSRLDRPDALTHRRHHHTVNFSRTGYISASTCERALRRQAAAAVVDDGGRSILRHGGAFEPSHQSTSADIENSGCRTTDCGTRLSLSRIGVGGGKAVLWHSRSVKDTEELSGPRHGQDGQPHCYHCIHHHLPLISALSRPVCRILPACHSISVFCRYSLPRAYIAASA